MDDVIFWDLGGYKRVLDELRRGQRSCELFVKMVQERAEIEERYSRSLDSWRERWTLYSVNGREVGGTVSSWSNCLIEATLVAKIHRECRNRIIRTGGPAENMTGWIQKNFQQRDENGLDRVQRLESDFLAASSEFTKAYERTLRVREAYHKLSDDAQKARRFADEESQDKFVNKSTKTRLFNRADKLTIQENYVRRIYKRRVDTCQGEVKDRYRKGMQEVLDRCQGIETARLQCIKNQMLTFITMLDMSGASKGLLDCSRLAYYDVTKTIPEQDVQTWLLRFNVNNFIELPSFEEYKNEDYERNEQDSKKIPSGSFFELSLFGSSSEEESSESDSESSSGSSTSSSESESSAPTTVSSFSNVSRKHTISAKNKKSDNEPQKQEVISHQTTSRRRQHSNNHIGYATTYEHAHKIYDQLEDIYTESSTQSFQLSDSIQHQSRITDNFNDKSGDLSKQSREEPTNAHTCQSTGFSVDVNNPVIEDRNLSTGVTTNDQLSHTNTTNDAGIHSENAQRVTTLNSSSFEEKIDSENGQSSLSDSRSCDDPGAAACDNSMKVETSNLYSSDYQNVRESDVKRQCRHLQEDKDSQTCGSELKAQFQNEDFPQMKCPRQFQGSLYKNEKWSSVVPPVTSDTSQPNPIYKKRSVKCQRKTNQAFHENSQEGEELTQSVIDKMAVDEHNLLSPDHEQNFHTERDDCSSISTVGVISEDQSHLGHSSCCQIRSDHKSGFGVHQTRKTPDRCLARWFLERYPEYEQLEEKMWSYLQRCNPARYHAALTDAKKLMLFVDTQSSNRSTKAGNVHLCNSFHICRRQYDEFPCQCLDQNQATVTDEEGQLFNNRRIMEAEDKFCQAVTSKLLSLRHFMEQNDEDISRDKCQMGNDSDHLCEIATGIMVRNHNDEVTLQRSIGCNSAKESRDLEKSVSKVNETEDVHEVDISNVQSRLQDEGSPNQIPTDIADESDFSTDDDVTENNTNRETSNNEPTLHFNDRIRAERDARLTLKPTQGEFLVRSLYNFSPANWDELKLRSGQYLIQIGRDSDNGWAMGRTRTKKGLFPASYVTFVKG